MAAMLTPSYLREKSNGEAKQLVDNYFNQPDKEPIKNKVLVDLVTDLVALMIQVKVSQRTKIELKVIPSEVVGIGLKVLLLLSSD